MGLQRAWPPKGDGFLSWPPQDGCSERLLKPIPQALELSGLHQPLPCVSFLVIFLVATQNGSFPRFLQQPFMSLSAFRPPLLSLPFPRLNNPGSFKLSSFLAASSPLTVLAALPALPPFGPHPPGNAASKPGRCRQQQECSARLAKHAAPPRPPVT